MNQHSLNNDDFMLCYEQAPQTNIILKRVSFLLLLIWLLFLLGMQKITRIQHAPVGATSALGTVASRFPRLLEGTGPLLLVGRLDRDTSVGLVGKRFQVFQDWCSRVVLGGHSGLQYLLPVG
jgi:hypothetical protein